MAKSKKRPFMSFSFNCNDFFSGSHAHYKINNEKKLDWQVEGIAYKDAQSFCISCKKSKDVTNTLYLIDKSKLITKSK